VLTESIEGEPDRILFPVIHLEYRRPKSCVADPEAFTTDYRQNVKEQKDISVVVTLLCFVLMASLQSAEPWKPLFNGKDFTGWTVPSRSGASLSPVEAGWKIENGGGLEPCPDLLQGSASPGHLERDEDLRRHRQPDGAG